MLISRIFTIYFSPTGKTEEVSTYLADRISGYLDIKNEKISITSYDDRHNSDGNLLMMEFGQDDMVIVGSPTYAGKIPNKMLPYFKENIKGNNTVCIPICTFGNRSFDNSLSELNHILSENGFVNIASGAFVSRHSFTDKLAGERPNKDDFTIIDEFAQRICKKIQSNSLEPTYVIGDFDAPYYTPLGIDGSPAKFLKAKPKTDQEKCDDCKICYKSCPMKAIEKEDTSNITGICIKCHACIRKCPHNAKFFDDPSFLSHVKMLEENYSHIMGDNYISL